MRWRRTKKPAMVMGRFSQSFAVCGYNQAAVVALRDALRERPGVLAYAVDLAQVKLDRITDSIEEFGVPVFLEPHLLLEAAYASRGRKTIRAYAGEPP